MKLPLVIPVRDRLTYLLALLEAVVQDDHVGTIHLFDMGSTFPPLLKKLEELRSPRISVVRLSNLGARGLLEQRVLRVVLGDKPFLLTDPDVIPERPLAKACLDVLLKHPRRFSKVGASLRIDDLPDHYPMKAQAIEWEKRHWIHPCGSYDGSALWDADVATTFCVVRSLDHVNGKACRIGPPFSARHIPWYEHPERLPPDVTHYYENAPRRRWGVPEAGVSWTPLRPR